MGFVANFVRFSAVEKFWKSVKNWQSYREFKNWNFFWDTVYMYTVRLHVIDTILWCRWCKRTYRVTIIIFLQHPFTSLSTSRICIHSYDISIHQPQTHSRCLTPPLAGLLPLVWQRWAALIHPRSQSWRPIS